ncbi:MAG: hypothetical protein ACF8PN_08790 [Phycisphaerales bacterium]
MRQRRTTRRTAFTLIETLIASVILLTAVMATSMALTSSHGHAQEFQDRVQAALAAEALMAQILANDYATLPSYDNHNEDPGAMTTQSGAAYPETYARVGRKAQVVEKMYEFPGLGVKVNGREVTVASYDAEGRTIIELVRFVPEPAS